MKGLEVRSKYHRMKMRGIVLVSAFYCLFLDRDDDIFSFFRLSVLLVDLLDR